MGVRQEMQGTAGALIWVTVGIILAFSEATYMRVGGVLIAALHSFRAGMVLATNIFTEET